MAKITKMYNDIYVHPSSVIDKNVQIGNGTKIWHFCHVSEGAIIGENCTLGQNVHIGLNVKIGNGCKIQNNVSIYEGVTLADYVFCGPSCVFTNDPYPDAKNTDQTRWRTTRVDERASIGANATIICGVRIGAGSLVGAGSVVTKDVPPFKVVKGNPAK